MSLSLPVAATPTSGTLRPACFLLVHAQHLFSSHRRLVLHIVAAPAAPSAPSRFTRARRPPPPRYCLSALAERDESENRGQNGETEAAVFRGARKGSLSFPTLSLFPFPSFAFRASASRGCRRQTSPTRLASRNGRVARVRLRFRHSAIVDRPANSSGCHPVRACAHVRA